VRLEFPFPLVLGHKITGVSDSIIELADWASEIRWFGIKQWLNVAVVFGIMIYEIAEIANK